ncbi:hypothetical protein ANCDUO_05855 [Ancylostoma duodenale]|uniref:DDE Tnp4 domain-containing protein n=1 Tax=Ancylostoma duodenale TaxID=51022 RepID=A0A0C2DMJ2_9BILA|nr:hypothetical protein ANCDUO_05855 [Ancylostoma duodenale]
MYERRWHRMTTAKRVPQRKEQLNDVVKTRLYEKEMNSILPALEALDDVVEVIEAVSSITRSYVRQQHMPSLCTRFLIFDQYLAFNDPERFCEYERLFPREFEDLYESIAPELGYGPSFVALAQEVCCGRKTVSDITDEMAGYHQGRQVEKVFGILVRRFEIFKKPMEEQPERAAIIITSILTVHNLLGRGRAEMQRFPPVRLDFDSLQRMDEGTGSDLAKLAGTKLTAYYDQL